jgi:protein arginine kinase activator
MLCEKCKKKKATVFYNENLGGKTRSCSLCADCAEVMRRTGELEDVSYPGTAPGFGCSESALFSNLCGITVPHNIAAVRTCPVCTSTLAGIAESGRVGCAACYQTFRDEISGAVHALPKGAAYPGRTPRKFRLRREREARASLLRDQMKQAVLAEDFETAALLRDQIHTLQSQD